jgi:hypothetical protein
MNAHTGVTRLLPARRMLCVASLVLAGLLGCSGTPDSVKALSAAQLKNSRAYCASVSRSGSVLKEYFKRQGEEKLKIFDQRHEQNTKDTEQIVRDEAVQGKWDAARTAAEVSARLNALQVKHAQAKQDLSARLQALNDALDSLAARCGKLEASQSKLNDYLQLKTSEDAVNQLMTETMGIDTNSLTGEIDKFADKVPKL